MDRLSHIGSDGRAEMVDVSAKPISARTAIAKGKIKLQRKTLALISKDRIAKGNVFATARLAGIQAAKQTAHLIPLCHTLPLGDVKIDIVAARDGAEVTCTTRTIAKTPRCRPERERGNSHSKRGSHPLTRVINHLLCDLSLRSR